MQLIKGKHAIEEALASRLPIKEIFVSQSLTHNKSVHTLMNLIQKQKIPVRSFPPQEFKRRFSEAQNQQIVARVKEVPIQPIDKLLSNPSSYPTLVCCDHLQDPYNFGAIIRTSFALGVKGIIFPKDRNVSMTAGVIKASSGAAYHVDLFQVSNLANVLKQLKKKGFWTYGADQEGAQSLQQVSFNSPSVLIVGNEHKGISPLLKKLIDQPVSIPMKGKLDSLNVSVATGIVLYQMLS